MRYGWPFGAHQPAEQLVGQRQRQPDSARLDLAPARGEVPQEQRQAHVEPRLRRDRALDVEVVSAPLGAAQQRLRSAAATGAPARRTARRAVRSASEPAPASRSRRPTAPRRVLGRLDQIPGPSSSAATRSPTRTLTASTPSRISTPGPGIAAASRGARSDLAEVGVERECCRCRPRQRDACGRRAPLPGPRRGRAGIDRSARAAHGHSPSGGGLPPSWSAVSSRFQKAAVSIASTPRTRTTRLARERVYAAHRAASEARGDRR